MRKLIAGVVAASLFAAATAEGVSTPTLMPAAPCWVLHQAGASVAFNIYGSGFTPGQRVDFRSDSSFNSVIGYAVPDTTGRLQRTLGANNAYGTSFVPHKLKFYAYVGSPNNVVATLTFPIVMFGTNQPAIESFPGNSKTPWAFAGLSGQRIYAHFVYRRSYFDDRPHARQIFVATTTFGRLSAPCQSLTINRALFTGVPLRTGIWRVQFDTKRSYRYQPHPRIPGFVRCEKVLGPNPSRPSPLGKRIGHAAARVFDTLCDDTNAQATP